MKEANTSIIYVDDIHIGLVALKDRLKYHYDIITAQSVTKLFELLEQFSANKRENPGLILLDLNMPEVDGFKALKNLKYNTKYTDIPVMLLSSNNDTKTVKKAMDLGAADFITKPFTDTELIDCIEYQFHPYKHNSNSPIILAIDDNPGVLMSVKHHFDEEYRVYLLQNSSKLKAVLKRIAPDLILLEYTMPNINGFELVPIIRDFVEHKETPIIFLTSDDDVVKKSDVNNLGAVDFIKKPIDENILREKAALHLSGFRMRRRLHNAMTL